MAPRSCIAASRLTITRRRASRIAPRGQRHRDDHRQELGRQADGQRQREQQRFQPGPVEQHVDHQHEQHQEHRQAQDQQPELAHAQLEGGAAVAAASRVPPSWPNAWHAGAADQHCAAADHRRAHEDGVDRLARIPRWGGGCVDPLLRRVGLPGQHGLVDEQVARLEEPAVGRHQVAGGQDEPRRRGRAGPPVPTPRRRRAAPGRAGRRSGATPRPRFRPAPPGRSPARR